MLHLLVFAIFSLARGLNDLCRSWHPSHFVEQPNCYVSRTAPAQPQYPNLSTSGEAEEDDGTDVLRMGGNVLQLRTTGVHCSVYIMEIAKTGFSTPPHIYLECCLAL